MKPIDRDLLTDIVKTMRELGVKALKAHDFEIELGNEPAHVKQLTQEQIAKMQEIAKAKEAEFDLETLLWSAN